MEQHRFRRQKAYERLFSARALCTAGLLVMPAFLFNPYTLFRVVQFLFFWFLCLLAGKKTNIFITILVIFGIVAFNLIVPYGQVLYSIGTFNITLGALTTGIHRAATLQGLIMLSRLSIRPDLKIPGGFGALVGESFRYFAIIMDSKKRVTRKNLIEDIDRLMIDLSNNEETRENPAEHSLNTIERQAAEVAADETCPAARTTAAGFIILAIVVILSWLLLVLPYLHT